LIGIGQTPYTTMVVMIPVGTVKVLEPWMQYSASMSPG